MKNVTIQDIARVAGVSKSTVSRVLNRTAAVAPEKRKAVVEATERLGFSPNVVARSLANGRSMTIGVLTQLIGSPFYDAISQGVIAGLADSGYSPLFADGQWQESKQVDAIAALVGRRVDGVVLIGGGVSSDEISRQCSGLPTVLVARNLPNDRHHCIFMDNVSGGHLATKYLLQQGHRQIAIIRGLEHHPDAVDRFAGYQQAFNEAGLTPDPKLIVEGDFSAESGIRAVNELLSREQAFTAIFAANDLTAFGARLALDQHGLQVPGDVSLIGFDDQLESAYVTPPLTTVRQPAREMGSHASEAILKLIEGGEFSSQPVQGELIIRKSVASRVG
ncbi:MAG: LacI family DNA-binding transcriptional regulator [Rubripirellula sp.]|nr:LacI family DNA-binding transcriptional regulator [Rubripirellula sp.]